MKLLQTLVPLLAGLVGAGAVIGGQWLSNRLHRHAKANEEWAAFQRETLVALQDISVEILYLQTRRQSAFLSDADRDEATYKLMSTVVRFRALQSRIENRELARSVHKTMLRLATSEMNMAADGEGGKEVGEALAALGDEIVKWHSPGTAKH